MTTKETQSVSDQVLIRTLGEQIEVVLQQV